MATQRRSQPRIPREPLSLERAEADWQGKALQAEQLLSAGAGEGPTDGVAYRVASTGLGWGKAAEEIDLKAWGPKAAFTNLLGRGGFS